MRPALAKAVVLSLSLLIGGGALGQPRLAPPTQPRDLVVFIADFEPQLYRLVGPRAQPFGNATFYSPQSIVADPAARCFYVLDRPMYVYEPTRIWRIAGDGAAEVVFEGHNSANGGPFGKPVSLGLDRQGRVLVADAVTGLWRLERDARLQRLLDGGDKPLYRITAVTGSAALGLVVGTSYQYEVGGGQMLDLPPARDRKQSWSPSPSYASPALEEYGPAVGGLPLGDSTGVGNSTGRQVPIRIWRSQGGVYRVDLDQGGARAAGLLVNRRPGGQEHDTYWRLLSQVFVDSGGRLVLVDAGSKRERKESVYIGPGRTSSNPRVVRSEINGGMFLLRRDGALEDLTFKTADGGSGPLRHPHAAAEWDGQTYIVADPQMAIPGGGHGGLLLLGRDGGREARWPLGSHLRPVGVAVLRGAGPPAASEPTLPLRPADLVGRYRGAALGRIEKVSWQRKGAGYPSGHPLAGLGGSWQDQPQDRARARLAEVFEGATWQLTPGNDLIWRPRSAPPAGNAPLSGQVTLTGSAARAHLSRRSTSLFDTSVAGIEVVLRRTGPDTLTAEVTATFMSDSERLQARFEERLRRLR